MKVTHAHVCMHTKPKDIFPRTSLKHTHRNTHSVKDQAWILLWTILGTLDLSWLKVRVGSEASAEERRKETLPKNTFSKHNLLLFVETLFIVQLFSLCPIFDVQRYFFFKFIVELKFMFVFLISTLQTRIVLLKHILFCLTQRLRDLSGIKKLALLSFFFFL